MSKEKDDPPQERVDSQGRPICRWCPNLLETVTYISIVSGSRKHQMRCRKCDEPDSPGVLENQIDRWRREFQ